jgi:hypothetical protein
VSGFVFAPLSLIFAWLTYLPLKYEIEIINMLASLGWASREVSNFSFFTMAVWYAVLITAVVYLKKIVKRRKIETIKEI